MSDHLVQAILCDRRIAYAITDRQCKVIAVHYCSPALQIWMQDWIGRALAEVVPEWLGSESVLADVLSGATSRVRLSRVNRELPDGRTAYLTLTVLPHLDDAGQISGLIHVVEDETAIGEIEQRLTQQRNELRLLQEELRQKNLALEAANAELRRLDQLKSTFVSIAAHELRTPLASISGYVEMLLDGDAGPLTDLQREYLRIVEGGARRLTRISRDLSDLTRIETGRLEVRRQPTDLGRLTEMVAAEHCPQLEERDQRLTLRVASGLPLTLCDPERAAQVIGNLLSNAGKYSPPGAAITLSAGLAAEAGFVQISVADEGVGIAEEDQPYVFDPFYRARNVVEVGASGTGLGLYIARSLVKLQGGRLWFVSTPGKGSTFFATFPVAAAAG